MNLKQIQKPIINEMDDFRSMLRSSISSNNILIDKVVNYILKNTGEFSLYHWFQVLIELNV